MTEQTKEGQEAPEARALVPVQNALALMPVVSLTEARARYGAMVDFVKSILREGLDFGKIPGTDKPSLLKPGAEKLCRFFGLSASFEVVDRLERWDRADPLFFYRYRCSLTREGQLMGDGEGSANSEEDRYRWRWVAEGQVPAGLDKATLETRSGKISEFDFAIEKGETTGKYGKPESYWKMWREAIASKQAKHVTRKTSRGETDAWEMGGLVYRIPNPDIFTLVNTLQKMGQKRAFVAATLVACNASEFFTQDVEDIGPTAEPDGPGPIIEGHFVPPPPPQEPASPQGPALWEDELVEAFLKNDEIVPPGGKHAKHVVMLLNLSPWKPGDGHPVAWKVRWGELYRATKVRLEQDIDGAPTKEDAKRMTAEAVDGANVKWLDWAQEHPHVVPANAWPKWADELLVRGRRGDVGKGPHDCPS